MDQNLDAKSCNGLLLTDLVNEGSITETCRAMIERFMETWQTTAFHSLLMTKLLTEAELANTLAKIHGLPRLYHLKASLLAEEALCALPFHRAREWEFLPLRVEASGSAKKDSESSTSIELACADPTRKDRIDELRRGLNCEITLAVGERSDIVRAIDELYPLAAQLPSLYGKSRES